MQSDPAEVLFSAYRQLKQFGQNGTPGYAKPEGYPTAFQANEFPWLAGENGSVTMLGANQAFYFTRTDRSKPVVAEGDKAALEEKVQLDISNLYKLMGNVYDSGARFTLMLDADAVSNHDRFKEKYLGLRTEPDAAPLQWHENVLIKAFLKDDGVRDVAREVVSQKNRGLQPAALEAETNAFLKRFQVLLVETEKPLEGAVWDVDGPEGKLCAKQLYSANTRNTERTFLMGTMPELGRLAQAKGTEIGDNSAEILTAVKAMHNMKETAINVDDLQPDRAQHAAVELARRQSGQERHL